MRIANGVTGGASFSVWRGGLCGGEDGLAIDTLNFGETAACANSVNVPLGEDRTQPSPERAAPVEITEQGAAIGAFAEAIEVREKGVRKFASRGRLRRAKQDGGSSGKPVATQNSRRRIPRHNWPF